MWTPGAQLAGFIKRTTIHCYTQNIKALGLVVSEKKIFFYDFLNVSPYGPQGHGWHDLPKWEALGLVVSEKIFKSIFHDAPGPGPVWTPGAGFIKRTTIHCYTQNMKALGLVVLEKKIFLKFFP